jgi:hypothetical protein
MSDGDQGKAAVKWGVAAMLFALAWQTLTVQANYAGNWTGLFRIGGQTRLPEHMAGTVFRNAHPAGYDGQFYLLLAHDPFLRAGTAGYLDAPLLRSRRILAPLAAWALAGGREALVAGAYVLVVAAFIFAGAYWLGRIMVRQGRPAALGLLFLGVPATLIGIDSMTVDVALAALTAGFAWHLLSGRERGLWLILAAAGLVRETGLLLTLATVLAALVQRDFRKAAWWATAAVPALGWYGYLHIALAPAAAATIPAWVFPRLQLGILLRVLDPPQYPLLAPHLQAIARALDRLALAATMAAAVIGALRLRATRPDALRFALGLYALLVPAMVHQGFWTAVYGYSRPLAPLFVLLLACAGRARGALACAVLVAALVDLRVAAEMQAQLRGVFRWLGALALH